MGKFQEKLALKRQTALRILLSRCIKIAGRSECVYLQELLCPVSLGLTRHGVDLPGLVEGDDAVEARPGLAWVHVVGPAHLARLARPLARVQGVVVHRLEGGRGPRGARHGRTRGTCRQYRYFL